MSAPLTQYSIDDIAYNYQADGNIVVTQPKSFSVGNDAICISPGVCVAANVYRGTANIFNQSLVKAYLNNKAYDGLFQATHQGTFSNLAPITYPINSKVVSTPINVTGLLGGVSKVTAQLHGLFTNDYSYLLMLLLQSPSGQVAELMWQGGGENLISPPIIIGFDDNGTTMPVGPLSQQLHAFTYHPGSSNVNAAMGFPAPQPPYVAKMANLNGSIPNGTWHLWGMYVDTFTGAGVTGGITLNITTA